MQVTQSTLTICLIVVVIGFIVLVIQEFYYAIEEEKITEENVITILSDSRSKIKTPGSAGPLDCKFLNEDFYYNAVSFK